jgi:ArsR family transcriptional regulator
MPQTLESPPETGMRERSFAMVDKKKKLAFNKQAQIARAVAHPIRVAILNLLKDREQCIRDIAEHVGSERSNVSQHLVVMANAGVLESRKEGLKVIYRLKTPYVLDFFTCATRVLKQQAKENEELLTVI